MSRVVILCGIILAFIRCSHKNELTNSRDKDLPALTTIVLDSMRMDATFYPFGWTVNGDILWALSRQDSLFLTGYDRNQNLKPIIRWGRIGQGPDDYIVPGIISKCQNNYVGLYSNTANKSVEYNLKDGNLIEISKNSFPIWHEDRKIPKPYTRVIKANDSIFIGVYFLPREPGADIFNLKNQNISYTVTPSFKPEDEMSGPYEFNLDISNNYIAVAYRYIDRMEFYKLNNDHIPEILHSIGDIKSQKDLYNEDRDDEMIKYYSDISCVSGNAYALYQGVKEENLEDAHTHLEIFDMENGKCIANIALDKYYTNIIATMDSMIYLYSPNMDDYVYISDCSAINK